MYLKNDASINLTILLILLYFVISPLIYYRAKMKVWILVLAVSSLVVSSSSQACPPRHFSAVIVASIDQKVEDPIVHIEDPELLFFRKGLHFEEDEIYHVVEEAITFFNYTFGLDFSDSPPDAANNRNLENAIMYPFVLRQDIN